MQRHVRLLAFAFLAFGAFWGLLASYFLLFGSGGIGEGWDSLALSFVLYFTLAAIPLLIAGWGLLHLKHWARLLATVLAVVTLPLFPIGTAFGVYALWVLWAEGTKTVFSPET